MNAELIASAAAVDLGEQASFLTEAALMTERVFGFTITNDTDTDRVIILNRTYKEESGNVLADGTINSVTGLSADSTGNKTIAEMKKYFAAKPARVLTMQVESNLAAQLGQSIVTQECSIFQDQPIRNISIAAFKDARNPNSSLINVTTPISWDNENYVAITVPKRVAEGTPTITTITLFFGAIYNEALALYRLAQAGGGKVGN